MHATRSDGEGDYHDIKVIFLFTPVESSLVSVEAPEVIYENQLVSFNCSPSDELFGVMNYSWFRDDVALPSGSDGELEVMAVPLSWNGSCLMCSVEGENGTIANASTTLTVVGK